MQYNSNNYYAILLLNNLIDIEMKYKLVFSSMYLIFF